MNSTVSNSEQLQRVVVVGSSCSGKSTLARALAAVARARHIELDELYWGPSWTPKPEAEFLSLCETAASYDAWVVAGNYALARPVIWPRATTIVWLNFGYLRMLWRALQRSVVRLAKKEVLFHGNRESFRRTFLSRDSILLWVATTFYRKRREFEALRTSKAFPHLTWLEFRHPSEMEEYLRALQDMPANNSLQPNRASYARGGFTSMNNAAGK